MALCLGALSLHLSWAADLGPEGPERPPAPESENSAIDRARLSVYEALWRSAMRIDEWFGADRPEPEYQSLSGSFAPAVLWDRHYGWREPVRFNVNWPLPGLEQRLHVFAGRLDPNEYVAESAEPSGSMPRQAGALTEDQTLLGITLGTPPRRGSSIGLGAGIHVALPLDPYTKASYQFSAGNLHSLLLSWKETAFWERKEGAGFTSRLDMARVLGDQWLLRSTVSGTLSQTSQGLLGWAAITVIGSLSPHQAVVAELEMDGSSDALVPLHSIALVGAYRQTVLRKWFIVKVRASAAWPKDAPQMMRRFDPGLGIGCEVLFGTARFLARPVTF